MREDGLPIWPSARLRGARRRLVFVPRVDLLIVYSNSYVQSRTFVTYFFVTLLDNLRASGHYHPPSQPPNGAS